MHWEPAANFSEFSAMFFLFNQFWIKKTQKHHRVVWKNDFTYDLERCGSLLYFQETGNEKQFCILSERTCLDKCVHMYV